MYFMWKIKLKLIFPFFLEKICSPLLHLYHYQRKSGMRCTVNLNVCDNMGTHDVCRMGCELYPLYGRIVWVMYSGDLSRTSRCFLSTKSLKIQWNRSIGTPERAVNCHSEVSLETQLRQLCSTAVSSPTAAHVLVPSQDVSTTPVSSHPQR